MRLTFLLLVAVWSVSLCVIAVASLPYSPVSMALDIEISVKSLLPEGWGFFTRTPRAIDLYLYRHTDMGWRTVGEWPISQPVNVFGLNRRPRAIAVQLALLLDDVKQSDWHEQQGGFPNAVDQLPVLPVVNPLPHPLLCGPYLVRAREPVPWAWFASGDDVEVPSWVIRLDAQCSPGQSTN